MLWKNDIGGHRQKWGLNFVNPGEGVAVIDMNVLVSAALKWKSVPESIMDLAYNGGIESMKKSL